MVTAKVRDRVVGCLLGGAVGDALGTTLEFSRPDGVPGFPRLAEGPHTGITGGGPFHVARGQVTDDTHMATCLWDSLRANGGFDAEDVARRYCEWRERTFDIGGQTSGGLSVARRILDGEFGDDADVVCSGAPRWESSGRRAAGNGSLMRTYPIAAFAFLHGQSAWDAALVSAFDSGITHFGPEPMLACASYNAAVMALLGGAAPEAALLAAAAVLDEGYSVMEPFSGTVGQEESERAIVLLGSDLEAARQPNPGLYGDGGRDAPHIYEGKGYVRTAYRLAFWELMHAPTYRAALLDVANRGGDADTNGAIAGALVGAREGLGGIPEEWADAVVRCHPREPFDSRWHPRAFLAMPGDEALWRGGEPVRPPAE